MQKLEDLRDAGSIPFRHSDGITRPFRVKEKAEELLKPWELFSRGYAQFTAEASGSAILSSQIQGFTASANPSSVMPQYWHDDDFREVSKSLNRLMMELGWKT